MADKVPREHGPVVVGPLEPEPARADNVPDAVAAGPMVYQVVFENDWVRVLSVTYAAGRAVPLHTHPDRVVYEVATGAARFEKAGMHEVDGSASRAARELMVELGCQPGAAVPAGDEPVATYPRLFKLLVGEKRVRVLAVTFGKGTSRPVALGDHVLVSRDKGTLVVTPASGQARALALEPGKVELFPAGVYTATNPTKESFRVVLFELQP